LIYIFQNFSELSIATADRRVILQMNTIHYHLRQTTTTNTIR